MRQCALLYAQIVEFTMIAGMLGHLHVKPPDIGGVVFAYRGLAFAPRHEVVATVRQKSLLRWQRFLRMPKS